VIPSPTAVRVTEPGLNGVKGSVRPSTEAVPTANTVGSLEVHTGGDLKFADCGGVPPSTIPEMEASSGVVSVKGPNEVIPLISILLS
jgi:hypothetical protein